MLDIAWTEILIIAVVAILVVGPRELPRMLRTIGNFMGQVRRMAGDFQRQFNDAIRDTELDDVRRGIDSVRSANPLNKMKDGLNPLKEAGDSMRKAVVDPGAPKQEASKATGTREVSGKTTGRSSSGAAKAGGSSSSASPADGKKGRRTGGSVKSADAPAKRAASRARTATSGDAKNSTKTTKAPAKPVSRGEAKPTKAGPGKSG